MLPTKQFIYVSFLFISIMIHAGLFAQGRKSEYIQWSSDLILPAPEGAQKQIGVAGVFAGVHDGVLLVAGGANFPDAMPWQGGKKRYHDEIYVLKLDEKKGFSWIHARDARLKQAIAYGASVTIPAGVVCIGGETGAATYSNQVFLMQWNDAEQSVIFRELPSLPIPIANAAVTHIGDSIYVAGGETTGKVSEAFFRLNLSTANPQWETLPSIPAAMSHSVAVAQSDGTHDCVYIIGGRTASASGISKLHHTNFCFDPATSQWKEKHPISNGNKNTNLSAGTGVALGADYILLPGGDNGLTFHKIETYNAHIAAVQSESEKQALQKEKLSLIHHHSGFSRNLYLYHTTNDRWEKIGELPDNAQVTTTLVKWKDYIFIPSGEIKPGVRTPKIMVGRILPDKQ